MIKQPGILITKNTFHINDTRRFKSVHFQDIKSNFVSQVITETPRAMSKKYTRISKSHIVPSLDMRADLTLANRGKRSLSDGLYRNLTP